MTKFLNFIELAIRAALFLFLPVYLLMYLLFQLIFDTGMPLSIATIFSYFSLVVAWVYERYKREKRYIDIEEKEVLESQIRNGLWEEIDWRADTLVARPTFDSPNHFMLNDKVTIAFSEQKMKLTGPLHYVKTLSDSVKKTPDKEKQSVTSVVWRALIIAFISMPFIRESGLMWQVNVLIHNVEARNVSTEVTAIDGTGNTVQNINNDGLAVETNDSIIYIKDGHSIVKTNLELKYEKPLVDVEFVYEVADLNVADDWLYYADYDSINRVRLDGTEQETLYELGHSADIHLVKDRLYFINYNDNGNIYSMTFNGQDLRRVADVEVLDLTAYEDELIVSYREGVDRISLDGSERERIIEKFGVSVVRHDDHYYYINGESYLYKQPVHSSTPRIRTRVLDRPIDQYTLTEDDLFYVQHTGVYSNVDRGLFTSDHERSYVKRLNPLGQIYNLTVVGDYLLFRVVSDDYMKTQIMSYDMLSGELDELHK